MNASVPQGRRRSLVGRLIVKDLRLYRGQMAGAVVAGVASLALSKLVPGDMVRTGLNVGFLLFMTTVVTFGVLVPMLGILKERQERTQLFVLSLPVSPGEYTAAKVLAALAAFLAPWILLTAGVAAATWASGEPRGFLPFFVAMMTFFLANFCTLMAVVVISQSELWSVGAILVTNVSVPIFLASVSRLPGVGGHDREAAATWSPAILTVLAVEAAWIAAALALALYLPSRRKDLV